MLGRRARSRCELDHVGLNHLTWERARARSTAWTGCPSCSAGTSSEIADDIELPAELLRTLGVVPSYYLRYFYAHDEVVARAAGRAVARRRGGRDRARAAASCTPTRRSTTKPELLEQRGGAFYSEAAVQLAAALLGSDGPASTQVVNLRNDGTLPFLPDDAVIEVPARGRPAGACAAAASTPLEPLYAGLVADGHGVRAPGARRRAARRPATGSSRRCSRTRWSGRSTSRDGLTDRLLAHNRDHLPWAVTPAGAGDRRRQQQDRRRAGRGRTASASASAPGGPFLPHRSAPDRRRGLRVLVEQAAVAAGLAAPGRHRAPRLRLPRQRRPPGGAATEGGSVG